MPSRLDGSHGIIQHCAFLKTALDTQAPQNGFCPRRQAEVESRLNEWVFYDRLKNSGLSRLADRIQIGADISVGVPDTPQPVLTMLFDLVRR
jgi:hypothetical protein